MIQVTLAILLIETHRLEIGTGIGRAQEENQREVNIAFIISRECYLESRNSVIIATIVGRSWRFRSLAAKVVLRLLIARSS